MPKIVPDVRRAAIASFRRQVAARGWKALGIRGLASACGIAAGTLYNGLWTSTTATADPGGGSVIEGELRRMRQDLERIVARAIEGHEAAEGIDAAFLPKFTARALEQWSQDPRTSWQSLSGILGRLIASP